MTTTAELETAIRAYNYDVFPPKDGPEFSARFPELLKVGQPAPDFTATLLDGSTVRLSKYWQRGPVLIEFGSLT